jgi:uncharacterized protein (DUF3084 family)
MKNVEEYCARLEREVEDQRLAAQQMRKAWVDRGADIHQLKGDVAELTQERDQLRSEWRIQNACIADQHDTIAAHADEIQLLREEVKELNTAYSRVMKKVEEAKDYAEALEWYGEQARLARLIHSEGNAGRNALAADGGKKARAALAGKELT